MKGGSLRFHLSLWKHFRINCSATLWIPSALFLSFGQVHPCARERRYCVAHGRSIYWKSATIFGFLFYSKQRHWPNSSRRRRILRRVTAITFVLAYPFAQRLFSPSMRWSCGKLGERFFKNRTCSPNFPSLHRMLRKNIRQMNCYLHDCPCDETSCHKTTELRATERGNRVAWKCVIKSRFLSIKLTSRLDRPANWQ